MKLSKNKISIIVIDLLILFLIYYSNNYIDKHKDMKKAVNQNIYYNLEYFKEELQDLNKNISSVLTVKDNYNNKEFISRGVIRSYSRCNNMVGKINGKYYDDNYIWDIYRTVNENIESIISDNIIDDTERQYLTTLEEYNNELLKECKKIMGKLYDEGFYDYNYQKKIEKKILKTQSEFSKKADEILDQEKYKILIDYKLKNEVGENREENFEQIKKYCEEIFSKVIRDDILEYDIKNNNKPEYVFNTPQEEFESQNKFHDKPKYQLNYDKSTKAIKISTVRYTIYASDKKYNEQELYNTAQNTVSKFIDKVYLYDKNIRYDEKILKDITYKYIQKDNDVYYEGSEIYITINKNKIITDFYIGNLNKNIISPSITKKDIENKIDGEILDIITIANTKGKVEYEAHIKDNNIIYSAVFDGYDGSLKYYGTDIRDYGKIIE
ncbi:hypothetical protein [Tepidibacter hydrothermalis]|uniref:Germination protein YpeB n=1 Tax=Tepidibacter hydrothermalis TaxID=3036126 RepID=A0ABY8EJE6_9FIRM|nr:hypothetical protein [Tepidibacter hydrothermalis]WFD11068.1 hypothetical protein P4S50_03050 [Tepidibacter hydrothermalis]